MSAEGDVGAIPGIHDRAPGRSVAPGGHPGRCPGMGSGPARGRTDPWWPGHRPGPFPGATGRWERDAGHL